MTYNWNCPTNNGLPNDGEYVWVVTSNKNKTKQSYYMCSFNINKEGEPIFKNVQGWRSIVKLENIIGWALLEMPPPHKTDNIAGSWYEGKFQDFKVSVMDKQGYTEEDMDLDSIEDEVNSLADSMFASEYGFYYRNSNL